LNPIPKPFARARSRSRRSSASSSRIQESEHQIITAYEVHERRPSDVTLWTPALDRHIAMFDRPPDMAAGNRGFASAKNKEAGVQRGVRRVILPRPGRTTPVRRAHERQRWFRAAASVGASAAKGASP
jgi:hypothetical protein